MRLAVGGSDLEVPAAGAARKRQWRLRSSHKARSGHLLLRGTVVTPDQVFRGEVLIDGDTITCVAARPALPPRARAPRTVVDTHGIIFPGLIDTHNHILFDIFDETDWAPTQAYANHNQWTNEARYGAMVDAKQYLNGESGSPVDLGCEIDKYGELKALIAGTTSIVARRRIPPARATARSRGPSTRRRTVSAPTRSRPQRSFPSTAQPTASATTSPTDTTDAYVIHIAEGIDATALNEFAKLDTVTTADGCLFAPETTIVHGTALRRRRVHDDGAHSMSLVWSPHSNVFLYGGGTDLTKTTNIPLARCEGHQRSARARLVDGRQPEPARRAPLRDRWSTRLAGATASRRRTS